MSFYHMIKNATGGDDSLYIDGEIVTDGYWWGSEGQVVARRFRQELAKLGNVTVYINSPGGDVFAGADIYTMLREHKGKVTVKVTGIAASAASVIAMAGNPVLISPVGNLMIHNPWTYAAGNAKDLDHWAEVLREIGEGLINAYAEKTGKSRTEIETLLEGETYMNAQTAINEGFADGLMEFDDMQTAVPPQTQKASALMQMNRFGPAAICAMLGSQKLPATFMGRTLPTQANPPAAKKPPAGDPKDQADPDREERDDIARRAEVLAGIY